MSSFTSACSSIDFGFSQCFGGWQNASVEVKLSAAGQSFPATATGMDVTESVSDLASKTFILTGATGTLGRACAKILRARGCKLIFASRDVEKASAFVGEMEKEDFEGEDEGDDDEDDEEEKDEEKEADEEDGQPGEDERDSPRTTAGRIHQLEATVELLRGEITADGEAFHVAVADATGMPTSACSMRNSDIVKPMPASIPTVTRCLPFMPLGNEQIPILTAP